MKDTRKPIIDSHCRRALCTSTIFFTVVAISTDPYINKTR